MPDDEGKQEKPRKFKMPSSSGLHFSAPLPGAPRRFWRHGSTSEIIVEKRFKGQDRPNKRGVGISFSEPNQYVIYHRDRPHIRLIFDLGRLKVVKDQEIAEGEKQQGRQKILGGRLEWEGLVIKRELREAANLLDELVRIEGGRPRGRTKNEESKTYFQVGIAVEQYIPRFKELIAKKKSFSKQIQQNKRLLRTELSKAGYSEAEIEAGISAQDPKVAARWLIANTRNLSRDSVAAYHKTYLAALHPE